MTAIRALDENADLIVPLGGASVGTRDLFRPAFETVGAKLLFWGINVVPGKPCWHARLADGRPVLGLPGTPASAFVCAHLLLRPLIDLCLGRDPAPSMALQTATLTDAIGENGAREAWLRARVEIDATGRAMTTVDPRQDSGLQTPLLSANALVRRLPFSVPCPAGSASNTGAMACNPCPIGTFAAGTGNAQCASCPAGPVGSAAAARVQ